MLFSNLSIWDFSKLRHQLNAQVSTKTAGGTMQVVHHEGEHLVQGDEIGAVLSANMLDEASLHPAIIVYPYLDHKGGVEAHYTSAFTLTSTALTRVSALL